ncbi:1536_t:CDS:1 [Funneliformis mosseae]|uniref:1536_t:CDS:1 n=1 Tax=Funneliformis mosseae TaxID=27381 RepID=A0A9N9ADM9_FUNMO|nr:1536_t:CDS:1 [Funneliformis mosseae]
MSESISLITSLLLPLLISVKKRMNRFKSNNYNLSTNPPRVKSFPISCSMITENVVSTLQFSFAITQALFFMLISSICTLYHVIILNYDLYYTLTFYFIYATLLHKKGKRVTFHSHDEFILPNSMNVIMGEEDEIENKTKRSKERKESGNNHKQIRTDSPSNTVVVQHYPISKRKRKIVDLTIDTSRKISKSSSEKHSVINNLKRYSTPIINNTNDEQRCYTSLSTPTTTSHSLYDVDSTFNKSKADTRSHEHNATDDNLQDTTTPSGVRRHTWITFIRKNDIQNSSTSNQNKRNSLGIWEKVKGNINNGSSRKNNDMNSNISAIIKQERSRSKLKKHKGLDPSPISRFSPSKHSSSKNFDKITTLLHNEQIPPIPISPTSTLVNVSIDHDVLNDNIKVRVKKRNSLKGFLKEFTNRRKRCDDKNSKKK